jgi:chromosome segregation ATPase
LTIKELEQKYSDLDIRLSKAEDCLRDANRRREELRRGVEWLKQEMHAQLVFQKSYRRIHPTVGVGNS